MRLEKKVHERKVSTYSNYILVQVLGKSLDEEGKVEDWKKIDVLGKLIIESLEKRFGKNDGGIEYGFKRIHSGNFFEFIDNVYIFTQDLTRGDKPIRKEDIVSHLEKMKEEDANYREMKYKVTIFETTPVVHYVTDLR